MFYVDSVVRNDSMARKKKNCYILETVNCDQKKKIHQLLHTGNSTADSDIKKNSCDVLETAELIPK